MFTSIRLVNFKCYRDSGRIPLRPLTIIVGPNNSGKSTILDSLLMLKQTLQDKAAGATLITSGPFAELGSFYDILRGGRRARNKVLSVELSVSPSEIERFVPGVGKDYSVGSDLSLSFSFDSKANKVNLLSAQFQRDGKVVLGVRRKGHAWKVLAFPQRTMRHMEVSLFHFLPVLRPNIKKLKALKSASNIFRSVVTLDAQDRAWRQIFENVRHVAPLRLPVPWYGVLGKMPTSELGAGGENLLRTLGNIEEIPGFEKPLVNVVDSWISKRFKMLKKLRLVNIDKAGTIRSLLGDETSGFRGINVAGMGEGLSQLLPIVTRVLTTKVRQCLLIEQPEIHLHPAAQADLADLFIHNLGRARRRQFIIETHSEHLLLRVRRRVADGTIPPDAVAVLYVEKGSRGSRVKHLELTGKGHFDQWPKGFFEEGYREAMFISEAASR